jgi:hypothetical protein
MEGWGPSLYDRMRAAGGIEGYNNQLALEEERIALLDEQRRASMLNRQLQAEKADRDYWAHREASRNPWKGMSYTEMAADPSSPAFESYDMATGQSARSLPNAGVQIEVGDMNGGAPAPVTSSPADYGRRLKTGAEQEAMMADTEREKYASRSAGVGARDYQAETIYRTEMDDVEAERTRIREMPRNQLAKINPNLDPEAVRNSLLKAQDSRATQAEQKLRGGSSVAPRPVAGAPVSKPAPSGGTRIADTGTPEALGNDIAARWDTLLSKSKDPEKLKSALQTIRNRGAGAVSAAAKTAAAQPPAQPIVSGGVIKPATPPNSATPPPENRVVTTTEKKSMYRQLPPVAPSSSMFGDLSLPNPLEAPRTVASPNLNYIPQPPSKKLQDVINSLNRPSDWMARRTDQLRPF